MRKPIIGITPHRELTSSHGSFIGVAEAVLDSVGVAGGVPLTLPYTTDEGVLREALALVDGVLIPGGEDLDPAIYGRPGDPYVERDLVDPVRDQAELLVAHLCLFERHLPILGVCRGLQVMNVAAGGTLVTDIPATFQSDLHGWRDESSWQELRHPIEITAGTHLDQILRVETIQANSIHHQAIERLGRDLVVNAHSLVDGIIEGVELPTHPYAIGVQCHPETLWQKAEPRWGLLFSRLVEVAHGRNT